MDLLLNEKNPKMSFGDYVYDVLKENIIHWKLKPGTRLSENEVSEYLNVSRTPVREAFIKLSREGVLEIVPQKGSYVSFIDMDIIDDVLFLRKNVETAIVRLAVDTMTEESILQLSSLLDKQRSCVNARDYDQFFHFDERFHYCIYEATGRKRIWDIIHSSDTQYKRFRMLTLLEYTDFEVILEQHRQIFTALRNGDCELAANTTLTHLNKFSTDYNGIREKYAEYFKQ